MELIIQREQQDYLVGKFEERTIHKFMPNILIRY